MARRRKRLGARESRPGESRPTESRPMESRPTESRPTESRPRVDKGQLNDIPNNATINDNIDETTTKNTTENLNNPLTGRKQVQVVNGLLDKSSECSQEITNIFKERIDDTGNIFVWDPETETRVRKAWDAKASGCYADFFRDIRAKMVKPIFMSDSAWTNFTYHWATSKYKEIQEKKYTKSSKRRSLSTPEVTCKSPNNVMTMSLGAY
nr:PDR ABC-type transporter family protein [Tanacetum cinerariifolium]